MSPAKRPPKPTDAEQVAAYMKALEHPFKKEIAAVRKIILAANGKLAERVKWKAPSFFYGEDFAAFNPRATEFAHLVLLFPKGLVNDKQGVLEGEFKDRRFMKFHSMKDVKAKQAALTDIVNQWVKLIEGSGAR